MEGMGFSIPLLKIILSKRVVYALNDLLSFLEKS